MSLRANNYYKATSLDDAYQKLKDNPKNAIIAGGLWMKKTGLSYETLIDLSELHLDEIKVIKDEIHVGALVSLRDFETNPEIKKLNGGATSFGVSEVVGPAFRNTATIGGSIFGRFPFSDVIASLLPLEVTVKLYPEQSYSLEEFLNIKGKVDGILTEIVIKKEEGKGYFHKVKATSLDFPMVNISISKRNNKHYIAVGSRPLVASLARKAMEAADKGEFKEAAKLASEELSYLDSNNISKAYRQDLVKVYVLRGLEEVNK